MTTEILKNHNEGTQVLEQINNEEFIADRTLNALKNIDKNEAEKKRKDVEGNVKYSYCRELNYDIYNNIISYPGKNNSDIYKLQKQGDKYKYTTPSGETYELEYDQVIRVCDIIEDKHKKAVEKYKSMSSKFKSSIEEQIKVLNLSPEFDEIRSYVTMFSMFDDDCELRIVMESRGVSCYSLVSVKGESLRINGLEMDFSKNEGLSAVALINFIKIEKSKYPKGSEMRKFGRLLKYGDFQRSRSGDLERDIRNDPINIDLLENSIIKKYLPTINKNRDNFLDYINKL